MTTPTEREALEALWVKTGQKLPERVWNNVHDHWQWEGDASHIAQYDSSCQQNGGSWPA